MADSENQQEPSRLPKKDPEFPNLTAMRDFDRQQQVERAIEAGLTREQAEKHADEHARSRSPRQIEEREE